MHATMTDIKTLKQYACDNYESGGDWIVETYSDSDYVELLSKYDSVEAAKAQLQKRWNLISSVEKDWSCWEDVA